MILSAFSDFKEFSVLVSTGTSKVDKLLKMPSDSITEGVIFQIFLGECPQTPSALHTMSVNMPASLKSTIMTHLVVPPFQKSISAPRML